MATAGSAKCLPWPSGEQHTDNASSESDQELAMKAALMCIWGGGSHCCSAGRGSGGNNGDD